VGLLITIGIPALEMLVGKHGLFLEPSFSPLTRFNFVSQNLRLLAVGSTSTRTTAVTHTPITPPSLTFSSGLGLSSSVLFRLAMGVSLRPLFRHLKN